MFDCLYHQQATHPLEKSFGHRYDGQWVYYSTQQMIDMANQAGCGLLKLGVAPGDKIALISYVNRPEWTIMDIALQQIGAIIVPVYPTISPSEYEYIFNDAEVKFCFVGKGDLYDKVQRAKANVPSLIDVYTFDKKEGLLFWKDMFTTEGQEKVDEIKDGIESQDLATIIYTSGTTGNPKGVMLSHQNIVSNVLSVQQIFPVEKGDRVLSFLPLCHIFERTGSFAYMAVCVSVTYVGTDNLGGEDGDLQAVKPNFFTTVPRLLEKVYEKIYAKGSGLTGVKRKLFFWALSLTDDYEFDKPYSGMAGFKRKLADQLIFSKWRTALGGQVKGIVSGAAACPAKIVRVFSAAGIPVREGYGLTETSPGLAIGRFGKDEAMIGTIGPALRDVELFIDDSDGTYREGEGEILARGPNIMMGYYNKPDKTAEVTKEIDGRQWFCTGDIGKLVSGPGGKKFLRITDRKKELLKTSGGKYVAPAPIENKFKEDALIEQIMVVGEKKKFVSALIIPSEDALKDWYGRQSLTWTNMEDAVSSPKVHECYQHIINKYNPQFSHIEQIKKFRLLSCNWEPTKADGSDAELTPTLKLKRRVIAQKHQDVISDIYA
ncbi:MAG: long-chain fatty acid--CoA ligase [Bacteroidota bacterium]